MRRNAGRKYEIKLLMEYIEQTRRIPIGGPVPIPYPSSLFNVLVGMTTYWNDPQIGPFFTATAHYLGSRVQLQLAA